MKALCYVRSIEHVFERNHVHEKLCFIAEIREESQDISKNTQETEILGQLIESSHTFEEWLIQGNVDLIEVLN